MEFEDEVYEPLGESASVTLVKGFQGVLFTLFKSSERL